MKRTQRGVTLVELLVVMLIIGILSAIAVPSYRQYQVRTNRTDAKVALMSRAAGFERCITRFRVYDSGSCVARTSLPEVVSSGTYRLELDSESPTTFVLHAVPLNRQADDDTQCATFTFDQASQKGVTGSFSATPEKCWNR